MVNERLIPFGTTIFAEMTQLAEEQGAINLSQGFPDFEGPPAIIDAAEAALRSGQNQYARSRGHPELVRAIAAARKRHYGQAIDPLTEVVVTSGATEAIASSMLGLLNPGDEVVLFEPTYDSYAPCVAMAGGVARYVPLRFPDFGLDPELLEVAVTDRTRMIVLNSPHNPTGKVFDTGELEVIAALARDRDLIVLSDEVYEHLLFDGAEHVPIATLPGMRERTVTLSSTGKTFSYTGWKIGWATGPARLIDAVQAAHQFVTYAVATPLQAAMARAIDDFSGDYLDTFRREYAARRDYLVGVLREVGFTVAVPRGTYFVLASFAGLFEGDDREFARWLTTEHRVAAIPPSAFYLAHPEEGRGLVRFAFCKKMETLEAAAKRLRGIKR